MEVVHPVMALVAVVQLGKCYMSAALHAKTATVVGPMWKVSRIFCIRHPLQDKETDEFDRVLFAVIAECDIRKELSLEQAEACAVLAAL